MSKFPGGVFDFWSWWWDGLILKLSLTLFVGVLAISWLIKKRSARSTLPLPPGPLGLPLLGNLPFLESESHRYFAKLSQTYGPIFKLKLGSKICVVISSPAIARNICKGQDAVFANRDIPASALAITYGGVDIGWCPHGPQWRKLRKIFAHELMSNTTLDACYTLRRQEVRVMVKHIYEKVASPIIIGEQMFLTLLNVATSMLWGGSLHGEERSRIGVEFRKVILEIVELLGKPNISDLFPILAPYDLQGIESKMKKLSLWFDRIFESIIAGRMKIDDKEKTKDLLHFLLELNHKGDETTPCLSMEEIKALFMDVVVAGTDTTSTSMEWMLTEMLRDPDKMRRLRGEVEEVVGKQNIVEEFHLSKLIYLDAFMKETLRLHPPLPLLVPHSPSMTCSVAGYTIPQGSRILINAWEIQRDPEVWENPLEFEPERFLKDPGKGDYHGNDFNFLPFGSGRRICAGIPLAEKMIKYVLATLLHSFEWELPEGVEHDLSEKFGFVLKRTNPLLVVPTVRLPTLEQYY